MPEVASSKRSSACCRSRDESHQGWPVSVETDRAMSRIPWVVARSPAACAASATRPRIAVLPPRLPVSPATNPAWITASRAPWSPRVMTCSANSHTPLMPAQKANPCSSASRRACSAKCRVSAVSPRSQ